MFCRYDLRDNLFPQSSLSVVVGVHDLNASSTTEPSQSRHEVQRAITHDNFTIGEHPYDIALFQVSPPIHYDEAVLPVCVDKSVFPARKMCVVTGFGSIVNVGKEPLFLPHDAIAPHNIARYVLGSRDVHFVQAAGDYRSSTRR